MEGFGSIIYNFINLKKKIKMKKQILIDNYAKVFISILDVVTKYIAPIDNPKVKPKDRLIEIVDTSIELTDKVFISENFIIEQK